MQGVHHLIRGNDFLRTDPNLIVKFLFSTRINFNMLVLHL